MRVPQLIQGVCIVSLQLFFHKYLLFISNYANVVARLYIHPVYASIILIPKSRPVLFILSPTTTTITFSFTYIHAFHHSHTSSTFVSPIYSLSRTHHNNILLITFEYTIPCFIFI